MSVVLRRSVAVAVVSGSLALAGCHHQTTVAYQPPPPEPMESSRPHYAPARPIESPAMKGGNASSEAAAAPPGFFDDTHGKPVFTETGMATWYGPYHDRRAADGTAFDPHEMTAAHRTLPMGSTVRVTNLTTGQQVLVRITDRGPFVQGRVLDLSAAAAKAVGVYRAGLVKVKLEAFAHPSADPEGKWCVQTGVFKTEGDAVDLKTALAQRYRGAKVVEFEGATGYWVRIDPAQHAKAEALKIADWIGQPDPAALPYLVRID